MLYIFGGLPGVGKSELSRHLAVMLKAAYIRIDTIEQKLRSQGVNQLGDQGYQMGFSLALDNLKNGITVITDSTNTVKASRDAWINVAKLAGSSYTEIEVICSDKQEHRHRVETRSSDIQDLILPSWQSVILRDYQKWLSPAFRIDTAGKTPKESKDELIQMLGIGN